MKTLLFLLFTVIISIGLMHEARVETTESSERSVVLIHQKSKNRLAISSVFNNRESLVRSGFQIFSSARKVLKIRKGTRIVNQLIYISNCCLLR